MYNVIKNAYTEFLPLSLVLEQMRKVVHLFLKNNAAVNN
jgi:hypothetical protein